MEVSEADLAGWSVAADTLAPQLASQATQGTVEEETESSHSISPSWQEAAQVLLVSSQEENEQIENACACRSTDSDSDDDGPQLAPELYWVQPLKAVLLKHLGPQHLRSLHLQVASACSGTLAEASALKDHRSGAGVLRTFFLKENHQQN